MNEEECQCLCGRRRSSNVSGSRGADTTADPRQNDGNSYGRRRFERLGREEHNKVESAAVLSAAMMDCEVENGSP